MAMDHTGNMVPIEWFEERPNGDLELITDSSKLAELNSALRMRLAIIDGPPTKTKRSRKK
jgi:hypothetical protein